VGAELGDDEGFGVGKPAVYVGDRDGDAVGFAEGEEVGFLVLPVIAV